jgi:serine/threonine protein kinase
MPILCENCKKENIETSKVCSNCDNILNNLSTALARGTILENRYRIMESMKVTRIKSIYKAMDIKLNTTVMVKEIIPPPMSTAKQIEAREWFNRESHHIAGLSHPNLPKIFDHFIYNNRFYLVMSFVEGKDLVVILREKKSAMTKEIIISISKQVLKLLDYLYEEKSPLIFRPILPDNFLVHKDGRVMLIDFCIAKLLYHTDLISCESNEIWHDDLLQSGNSILPDTENFIIKVLKYVFSEKSPDSGECSGSHLIRKIHKIKDLFSKSLNNSSMEQLQEDTVLENRYKIIKLIKAGGMGAVYKAMDMKLETLCAIKELLPFYGSSEEKEEARKWFKREAEILARLNHPGIPGISDYFISNNRYYLAMDFIDGDTLRKKLIKEGKPGLPEKNVIEWAKEILDVLNYLHRQNPPVIYRDIKPSNIIINKNGRIKLIDFGIARILYVTDEKMTKIGTEGYCPLEQYHGKPEIRSDIYALGATMHHLLTGIDPVPFKFKSLREINPSISTELEYVVMKALEEPPEKRFSNAEDMLDCLNKISKFTNEDICNIQIADINDDIDNHHKEYYINLKNSWAFCIKGGISFNEERYEEALKYYDMALDIYEDNEIAWNYRGGVLYKLGDYEKALKCFDRALELNQEYEIAWNYRGEALYELGLYEEALTCFNRALKIDNAYSDAEDNRDKIIKEHYNH